jgi:hypothetical protein
VATTDLDARASALAEIVAVLRARQDELVDVGIERIFEIPAYARMKSPAFVADVRKHVDLHHDALVRSVEEHRSLERDDLSFIRPIAARRVGRIPLGDFLWAFRTYLEVFWQAVIDTATEEHTRAAALELAGVIIRQINVAATESGEAYVEAEKLLLAQGDRVRRDLLEDLLAGRTPEPGPQLTAAREAGLHPPVPCVVIVAVPLTPPEDEHALRAVAVTLARAVGSSMAPLTVTQHEELVLIPRVERDVRELVKALAAAHEKLATHGAPLAIGVSAVRCGLSTIAGAYREAQAALERVRESGGMVALPALSVFDCLTMFGRETALNRIPESIRRFVADDQASGGVLTMTLLEYVAADFNARATAERLFLHPNTARYRLGKIEERTGCDLRCVADVMDLLTALRIAQGELADAG